jgi:RES domain-containing protein
MAYASSWSSGAGAQKFGGRWNPKGVPTVYASLDAATAILEVAVHKTFPVLDTVPHVITCFKLFDANDVLVVTAADIPNPAWLQPGTPSAGQQAFGAQLMARKPFVLLPSSVCKHSWNLIFNPVLAASKYALEFQEQFGADGRLNPPH